MVDKFDRRISLRLLQLFDNRSRYNDSRHRTHQDSLPHPTCARQVRGQAPSSAASQMILCRRPNPTPFTIAIADHLPGSNPVPDGGTCSTVYEVVISDHAVTHPIKFPISF